MRRAAPRRTFLLRVVRCMGLVVLGSAIVLQGAAAAQRRLVERARPPSTPILSMSKATKTTLTVAWRRSKGRKIVAYRVYLDGSALRKTTSLSTTIAGLKCATAHTVQVEAIATGGIRSRKGKLKAKTTACPGPAPTPSPEQGDTAPPPAGWSTTPPPPVGQPVFGSPALYVATNGFDSGTCTVSAPCATLQHAYQLAAPGALIQVAGGTYPAQTIAGGSAPKPAPAVTFASAPGSTVTISGVLRLGKSNNLASGNTPDHLAFDGININGGCLVTVYNRGPQSTDLSFRNAHIQALNNSCHLVDLMSNDHVLIQNVELGPMCCNGDAVELAIPRNGAPNPSNITLDHVYIHDIYDSCKRVSSSFGSCSVQGFGDGCSTCDHVDGLQAFGGSTVRITNSRVYAINPGGPVGQGLFFQSANGGRFSDITLQQDMVDSAPNNDVAFSGPGNSVFSGSLNLLYNTFRGDFHIYDTIPGPDARVVAPGATIKLVGNIIGSATNNSNASLCKVVAGDGSTIIPLFSHNVFGNATCDPTDIKGVASYVSTNRMAPDLHLTPTSLGINAGDPTLFASSDIDGKVRPAGGAPDAGASENG